MVADLEAITGQVGAAEVCLLGQYNSCPHTIAYAARHPERSWTTSMGWARRAAGARATMQKIIELRDAEAAASA
jgi:hypothetical protein